MKDNFDRLLKINSLVELLSYRSSESADKLAYRFLKEGISEAEEITYKELDRRSKKIAARLHNLGMKGKTALLLYPSGIDYIAAFFGCLYAGAIAVTAYPPRNQRHRPRIQAIAKDANIAIALTTESYISKIRSLLGETNGFKDIEWLATDSINNISETDWQDPNLDKDSLAFLQYTSGSTGKPKGVMVSHGNMLHNSALIYQYFEHTPESSMVSWLPIYHDMGLIGGILQPLYGGFPATLMSPENFLKKPLNWLEAISKYKGTTSGGPNFAYDLCVSKISAEKMVNLDLSSWEVAFNGSEPIRAETLEKFVTRFRSVGFGAKVFYPCYGMAETTLLVSGASKKEFPVIKSFDRQALLENKIVESFDVNFQKIVGCGQIKFNQKVKIVAPESFISCEDEIGEIWVASESVAKGYWGKKEETENIFNARLADTKEGPFLRTGDLGFIKDGELFITGRLKDLIIIRGRNYYPQDIELTVEKSHKALRSSCGAAFAVEKEGQERLVIVQEIERTYRNKLNVDEVFKAIRRAVLEEQELTVHAILLIKTATISKTSSGKIQRRAVKNKYLEASLEIIGQWEEKNINYSIEKESKAGSIENWLVDRIAKEIQIAPQEIDIKEPFFSFGIDSVKAVSIVGELETFLNRSLSATLLYDYPSIENLARYLNNNSTVNELNSIEFQKPLKETEAIAIVGMSCRFPKAKNPQEFWQLLRNGIDAISEMPLNDSRSKIFTPEKSKRGGFLERVDAFDADFFCISGREAEQIDPQQRLLLEVCWEALENSSIASQNLAGSNTGVFIGISNYDYARIQNVANVYAGTGNAFSIAANRLSYILDLRGPSLAIDTACSSSLVAVDRACQSLRQNECNLALAGGVNLILSPDLTESFAMAGMLASDDRCKTFDADADGYVRGEGCGIIVLKRLEDAVKNRDNILAVIKGSAVNQDGRSNGLTAPNSLAQEQVIKQALANAGIKADRISYIEAHGTGTSLGDPIELNALKNVLFSDRYSEKNCWVGSLKTNIGHLEAAAGIAGLIKVVLALKYGEIPPHLNYNKLNPHVSLENSAIKIPTELKCWSNETKIAGVSSFGFGGTNAHIILEAAPKILPTVAKIERPHHIFTLSAKNKTALRQLVQKYREFLESEKDISTADICFNVNTGRSHFKHRLATIVESSEQLLQELKAFETENSFELVTDSKRPKIAFLFTGQGSQYIDMGQQLYENSPTFRQEFDRCDRILEPLLEKPLLEIIGSDIINQTAYTQPAIFALEYALAKLWMSWGIKPDAVMGHSLGEYVAATIAGVFSLEDALKLICDRAKLIQSLPQNGAMVAVFAEKKEIETAIELYKEDIAIAAFNGADNIVISGEKEAVKKAIASLEAKGIKTKSLQVSHAFHSQLMQPILAEFETIASKISYKKPQITLISNLTGGEVKDEITNAKYWVNHLRQPVKFAESITNLEKEGYKIFLEIGAKPTLLGMGSKCLPDKELFWLPSLRPNREDWQQMLESLGQLYLKGIEIDWLGFDKDYIRSKMMLPTYAFQRQRYWVENLENESSSIFEMLDRGETEQLTRELEKTGEFQPEQIKLLPQLLEVLAKQHQKELTRHNIEELLYQIEWQLLEDKNNSKQPTANSQQPTANWLIFADTKGIGKAIASRLQQLGIKSTLVYSADNYQKLETGIYYLNPNNPAEFENLFRSIASENITRIIHLWSLEAAATEQLTITKLEKAQTLGCGSLLHIIQSLSKQQFSDYPKLWLITRAARSIFSSKISVAQTPIWGMGQVVALEYPQLWGGLIDLDLESSSHQIEILIQQIQNQQKEDRLAIRDRQIYVARLVKQSITPSKPFKLSSEATYLITGGMGALGLQVAKWMVKQGARHLVLTSRSGISQKNREAIAALKQTGTNVLVYKADICSTEDTIALFELINKSMPALKGIIHAAGIVAFQPLKEIQLSQLENVLAPKVIGSWILHQLTEKMQLDFFIGFSSIASVWGSTGQGHYAAANHFIDELAHYRQAIGLPGKSINWGSWDGGGMADREAKKMLNAIGVESLPGDRAIAVLDKLMAANCTQTTVARINWNLFKQIYTARGKGLLLEKIETKSLQKQELSSKKYSNILQSLAGVSQQEGFEILKIYIRDEVAKILKLKDLQTISYSQDFFEMGMDSLMALELKNKLETNFNRSLPATLAFEFSNIQSICQYLSREILKQEITKEEILNLEPNRNKEINTISNSRIITREKATETLAKLEIITDEEVDRLLNNLLAENYN